MDNKTKMESFMEFCAKPLWEIAQFPLSLYEILNKWFEHVIKRASDGRISEWISDFKYKYPKIFWGTAIIWGPLLLWLGIILFEGIILWSIMTLLGLTAAFTIFCKLIHILHLLLHSPKT